MRAALLTLLAGCSFVVPPRAWHPAPDVDDQWSCAPRVFPIVDGTLATGLLATSVVLDIRAQTQAPPEAFPLVAAAYAAIASVPWIASAIYGGVRLSHCTDELARHNTTYFRPRL